MSDPTSCLFVTDHLPELTSLLSSSLPSLRVLDLSDNHICDLAKITALVATAASIRSISLSGNPAFVSDAGRFYIRVMC